MLDRVDTVMGYASFNGIKNSIKRYIEFHNDREIKAPIDYSGLISAE